MELKPTQTLAFGFRTGLGWVGWQVGERGLDELQPRGEARGEGEGLLTSNSLLSE